MVLTSARDGAVKAASAAAANSAALRRHFAALTAALLAPFAPYLEPAPPPPGDAPVPLGTCGAQLCVEQVIGSHASRLSLRASCAVLRNGAACLLSSHILPPHRAYGATDSGCTAGVVTV